MKRIISFILVCCFVISGAAVVAYADVAEATTTESVLRLSHSEIDRLVRRGNLTIRNNEITIQNIDSMLGNEDMIPAMLNSIDQLRALQRRSSGALAVLNPADLDPVNQAIIQSLTNDVVSFEMNIAQITGQIEQIHNAPRAARDRTAMQLGNVNRQIIWGAESLFLGYHALARQLEQSNETLKTLDRNITAMERRVALGQITARTVESIRNNRSQLAQGIKTMEAELGNLSSQINLLLGRAHDAPLQIGPLPAAERDFLRSVDRTRDLRSARNSNHLINIARIDIDEHARQIGESSRRQEAIARNNYDSEVRAVELRYENLTRAITERQALLTLEETQLNHLQQTLEETRRRHGVGLVSRNDLEQAESEVALQTIRVKSADAELFTAIRRYDWLIRGLSV